MMIDRTISGTQRAIQVVLVATLLAMAAQVDAKDKQQLVGSWFGTAVATTVPLPPEGFHHLHQRRHRHRIAAPVSGRHPVGAAPSDDRAWAWERTGDREFAVTLMLLYQGAPNHPTAPGEVLAIENVRMRLTVDRQGNRLSGTLLDELRDLDGAVIFLGPGTYEAVRIGVVPLP